MPPAPALLELRRQLEEVAAPRDGLAYWIMGDYSHRQRRSAHNQGNALDAPTALLGLYRTNLLIETIRYDAAIGAEKRIRMLIWARRYCSAKTGWQWEPYRGANPHEWHAHIEIHALYRWRRQPWRIR